MRRSVEVPTTLMGAEGQTPLEPTPPPDSQESDSPVGLTAEEVEARWRHRVSQKDKAHDAAEKALREENDALKRQLEASRPRSGGQSGNGGGNGEDTAYLRDQLAQREREVEQERSLRTIEAKRAKYPALAKSVGETGSGIFATADDATLARLNAMADDDTAPTFAPTTPRKAAPGQPKSLTDMDKAELEAELKRAVARGDHQRR
jgi:molybdopterin converting factor small subunit